MKILILIVSLCSAFLLLSCSSEDNAPSVETKTLPNPLAEHVIDDNTSLAPMNGRRIRIHSPDPQLSKSDCIALVNHYKNQAGPEGQVSVHKPSTILENTLNPWCVENFDGKGIQFHDQFFVLVQDEQDTDKAIATPMDVIDYHLDLKVNKPSPDTIIATIETNLPEGSRILLTATRMFTEKGNTDDWGGELFEEEVSLSGTGFNRSIKVDDRIWINERNSKKSWMETAGLWSPIDKISDKVSLRAMFSTHRKQPLSVLEVLGGKAGARMGGEQVRNLGSGKAMDAEEEISVNLNK